MAPQQISKKDDAVDRWSHAPRQRSRVKAKVKYPSHMATSAEIYNPNLNYHTQNATHPVCMYAVQWLPGLDCLQSIY